MQGCYNLVTTFLNIVHGYNNLEFRLTGFGLSEFDCIFTQTCTCKMSYLYWALQSYNGLKLHLLSLGRIHVRGLVVVPHPGHVQSLDVVKALLHVWLDSLGVLGLAQYFQEVII